MRFRSLSLLAPLALWPATASATPAVLSTVVRAPLVGQLATPAPGQQNIGFYGTDLGYSMVVPDAAGNKQLRIVFGDTWATSQGVDPIQVYRGGLNGTLLNMGPLRTPVSVFFNSLAGANAGAFAPFLRSDYLKATIGPSSTCTGGFFSDPDLGISSASVFVATESWAPCLDGFGGGIDPTCLAFAPGVGLGGYGGICVDTTSSGYLAQSHLLAATNILQVGNADPQVPNRYYTQDWPTTKITSGRTRR